MGPRVASPPPLFEPGDAVAVLGLGISGVAAARLAARQGARVYASDAQEGPAQRRAAEALAAEGVEAEVGGHDLERILASRLVVTSPGISPHADIRRVIAEAGVRTVAEVELAFRHLRSRIVGITGTNGKTTTTELTAWVLNACGLDAVAAGNVGTPLSETALADEQPDWVVVELSSFQLADLERFRPEIGVLLNLAPDHLDRYRDAAAYYADKRRLFVNADERSRWVLNADDPDVQALASGVPGRRWQFSLRGPVAAGAWIDSGGMLRARLDDQEVAWVSAAELSLLGRHNVANALAAGTAAALAGCAATGIGGALRSFQPLAHRLQPIGERDGVLWVNDSKATNVSATRVALESFDRPVILLLGGRHKGEPYSRLEEAVRGRVRTVIAFGEAAPRVLKDLRDIAPEIRIEGGMDAVVRAAAEAAQPGDVVLLSPACSSYDMFPHYAARGEAFARSFRGLPSPAGSGSVL